MTDISFYHLQRQPLSEALPRLLERVLASELHAVVLCGAPERMRMLDDLLWTYGQATFLPHGTSSSDRPDRQPVYLTLTEENPNQSTVLVVVDGATPACLDQFDRCLDMFDGNDNQALEAARDRWRQYRESGHSLTYWQQTSGGGWEKKSG
jgi:DNA polymerase-3 subunit chi